MAQGHTITITPSNAHVEVVVKGLAVAESDRPVLLDETGLPTRYYLRREDVRSDLLRPTNFQTTCPFKGQASYRSLDLGDEEFDGIAWSYETPIAGAEGIAAPLPLRVLLEVVDDLSAQQAVAHAARLVDALGDDVAVTSVLLHGEGTSTWPVLHEANRRGFDVRIGLEDVLELPDGSFAEGNAQLVAAARMLLDHM